MVTVWTKLRFASTGPTARCSSQIRPRCIDRLEWQSSPSGSLHDTVPKRRPGRRCQWDTRRRVALFRSTFVVCCTFLVPTRKQRPSPSPATQTRVLIRRQWPTTEQPKTFVQVCSSLFLLFFWTRPKPRCACRLVLLFFCLASKFLWKTNVVSTSFF